MHASVRNTTFAALVTAGFVAVNPAAYADTVGDNDDLILPEEKWEPLITTSLNVCDTSLPLVQHSAVCAANNTPVYPVGEQPAPAEPGREPGPVPG